MLNHVEYPSSVKEGTETPGAFDQNGQRFYVLDRLQEQASRIRYLLDTTVFFRDQLEACQAAGNAEAAQSTYLSLSSGRIGIANGVRSLKPLLLELEHPAASICEALVDQISSFELMTRDYPKQDRGFIHTCEWEELTLPVNELTADPPKDMRKAKNYLRLLQEGTADFPPLVCVNRMVIDGQHRFWAYRQAGFQQVKVYQNKPWAMPAAA